MEVEGKCCRQAVGRVGRRVVAAEQAVGQAGGKVCAKVAGGSFGRVRSRGVINTYTQPSRQASRNSLLPAPCSEPPAGEEPLRMQDLNVCSSLVQTRELTRRNLK